MSFSFLFCTGHLVLLILANPSGTCCFLAVIQSHHRQLLLWRLEVPDKPWQVHIWSGLFSGGLSYLSSPGGWGRSFLGGPFY